MFDQENGLTEIDVPVPDIAPNEALIQVLRVGICNTDLEILLGYAGFEGTSSCNAIIGLFLRKFFFFKIYVLSDAHQ